MPRSAAPPGVLLALVAFTACAPPEEAPDTAADVQAIQELTERELTAFRNADIDALVGMLTPEAIIIPPNEPMVQGSDAVRAWAENFYRMFSVDGRYTSSEVRVVGDAAYQWVTFELTLTPVEGGEPIQDIGKGAHVLLRQPDGSWKIALDVWNSSQPLPGM